MFVSVILPSRNRSRLLRRTLEHIGGLRYPPEEYEVVVVDTASTDDTGAMCREAGPKCCRNFRYERCERPGLHVGRNHGAAVARGEILVFADDDIRPFPTWLDGMARAFSRSEVGLAGGNDLPDFETPPPPWVDKLWGQRPEGRVMGTFSLVDFGDQAKEIPPQFVFGCNFGVRKELWRRAGGFHPDGMPKELIRYRGDGETALAKTVARMGCRAFFQPEASVYHWVSKERMTIKYLEWRGFIQGVSDSYSAIREAGSLAGVKAPAWMDRVRAQARRFRRMLRQARGEGPRAAYAKYVQDRGHDRGYLYHQREARRDPKLVQWILRADYFDADVPRQG